MNHHYHHFRRYNSHIIHQDRKVGCNHTPVTPAKARETVYITPGNLILKIDRHLCCVVDGNTQLFRRNQGSLNVDETGLWYSEVDLDFFLWFQFL